jgi:hypothetical protein
MRFSPFLIVLASLFSLSWNLSVYSLQIQTSNLGAPPIPSNTPTAISNITPTIMPLLTATQVPADLMTDARSNLIAAEIAAGVAIISAIISLAGLIIQFKQTRAQLAFQRETYIKDFEQKSAEFSEKIRQFNLNFSIDQNKFTSEHPLTIRDQALQILNAAVQAPIDDLEITGTPYTVGPPVKPENFIGRANEVDQIYFRLQSAQMMSSSILGLQKSGKTSLLYYLADPKVKDKKMRQNADRIIIAYINMQEEINTPRDFYRKMLSSVIRALSAQKGMPINHLPAGDVLRGDVDAFLDQASVMGLNIVFLVDEFDRVLRGKFDVSFLEGIRAWQGMKNLAWIFASHKRLETIGNEVGVPVGSPYYNIFVPPPIVLGAFTLAEAQQLILHPTPYAEIDYSDEEINELIRLSGRLPYVLQTAAAFAYQNRQISFNAAVEKARSQLYATMSMYYFYIWEKQLTKDERQIIKSISQTRLAPYALRDSDFRQVDFLQQVGLLELESDQLVVSGEVFQNWLKNNI